MSEANVYVREGSVLIWLSKTQDFDLFHDHLYAGDYFAGQGIVFSGNADDFVPLLSEDTPMTAENVVDIAELRAFLGQFLQRLKPLEIRRFHALMLLYDHDASAELGSDSVCAFVGAFRYE